MEVQLIKVVDSNFLRNGKLIPYLSKSTSNKIILSETILTEMFKRNPEVGAPASLKDMAPYAKQVLVTKQFPLCYHFSVTSGAQARRFIDKTQTAAFPTYVEQLLGGDAETYLARMVANGHEIARLRMKELGEQIDGVLPVYWKMSEKFSAREITAMQKGEPYAEATQRKVFDLVSTLAATNIKRAKLLVAQEPKTELEFYSHILWRYSLIHLIHFLRWVRGGQPKELSRKRLINDSQDMHVIALGTCFGGVLSGDTDLLEINREARFLLRAARVYVG